MKSTIAHQHSEAALHLGFGHGYRFDGDRVVLHAELSVPAGARVQGWSLELWACEVVLSQPVTRAVLEQKAHRVARVELSIPTPIRPLSHSVESWTDASLPVQGRDFTMLLTLADESGAIKGFSFYPQNERFVAPRLHGSVGYVVDGDEVTLSIEQIDNPRDASNVSGTLLVELCAIEHALQRSTGHVLASFDLEPLLGNYFYQGVARRVPFQKPPVGNWTVALRLREWTLSNGYVTRDQRVFELPYEVAPKEVATASSQGVRTAGAPVKISPSAASPSAASPSAASTKAAAEVKATAAAAPTKSASLRSAEKAGALAASSTKQTPVVRPAVPANTQTDVPAKATASTTAHGKVSEALVSIQHASVEELAKVRGLSQKIAKEIVKSRPFSSLDDLARVRGIGKKSLRDLKSLLKL